MRIPTMSLRQKLTIVLGATLLAACSSPTAPPKCGVDVVTIGSSYCAAK
jgi:hypothetical protein